MGIIAAAQDSKRRAIQLGLRGIVLQQNAEEWTVEIEGLSEFVVDQGQHVPSGYSNVWSRP